MQDSQDSLQCDTGLQHAAEAYGRTSKAGRVQASGRERGGGADKGAGRRGGKSEAQDTSGMSAKQLERVEKGREGAAERSEELQKRQAETGQKQSAARPCAFQAT
jgi:hypothetical protein